jgi:hypothetical protein
VSRTELAVRRFVETHEQSVRAHVAESRESRPVALLLDANDATAIAIAKALRITARGGAALAVRGERDAKVLLEALQVSSASSGLTEQPKPGQIRVVVVTAGIAAVVFLDAHAGKA